MAAFKFETPNQIPEEEPARAPPVQAKVPPAVPADQPAAEPPDIPEQKPPVVLRRSPRMNPSTLRLDAMYTDLSESFESVVMSVIWAYRHSL